MVYISDTDYVESEKTMSECVTFKGIRARLVRGVYVIRAGDVLEFLAGKKYWLMDYNKQMILMGDFLEKVDAHYYSEEKQNFFVAFAVQEAKDKGKKVVVVENIS